jgi:hypothetical protein
MTYLLQQGMIIGGIGIIGNGIDHAARFFPVVRQSV